MGLSTALTAGVSGIQRHQLQLDVIGNDIANVNTYGYKEQRVVFQDVLYNTIKSGTAPAGTSAGTNPSQVGSGVDLASVQTNFNTGDIETTGIMTDMAIEGNGFFIMKDGINEVYTRDGAFTLSQERKLVNGASGMVVQGWVQSRDNAGNSTVNTGGAITDITIPVGDNRIAKATTNVVMNGNLNNDGVIATSGTIFNSQRLFSSSSGDVEIASGSHDLANVYIKDPAGGADNVRLYKGTGSSGTDTNVLTAGDQIIVQLMKGGRPLEAIFVYGDGDTTNNATGLKGMDGTPDAGLESYDGTTLNDFMKWFDEAFGLKAVEDVGSGATSNAAHGTDGDNPNDVFIDMKDNAGLPFNDETDGAGFDLLLSSKIKTINGRNAATGNGPQAVISGSSAQGPTYNIFAGSAADVGTGNSYIDIDGDNAYNATRDIILKDTVSYVVTGNNTVTAGGLPNGSSTQIMLRSIHENANSTAVDQYGGGNLVIADGTDMFIDVDGGQDLDAATETIVKGAWTTSVFGSDQTVESVDVTGSTMKLTFSLTGANNTSLSTTTVTQGMSIYSATSGKRYIVTNVDDSTSGKLTVTFNRPRDAADAAVFNAATTHAFQGAALVQAGYTATSSSGTGSTLVSQLNAPVATKDSNGKFQGRAIYTSQIDNEKGMAGSIFTGGDVMARASKAPTMITYTAAADVNGRAELTVAAADIVENNVNKLQVGMTIYQGTTKYTIDEIDTANNKVYLDQSIGTNFGAATLNIPVMVNGIGYLDADSDGALAENTFRVFNTKTSKTAGASTATGTLFFDTSSLNAFGTGTTTNIKSIDTNTTVSDLSSFGDNAIVFTDTTNGDIYRKVPTQYDLSNKLVYLDKANKATYDEVRYDVVDSKSVGVAVGAGAGAAGATLTVTAGTAADTQKLFVGMTAYGYNAGTTKSVEYTISAINQTTGAITLTAASGTAVDGDFAAGTVTFMSNNWVFDEDMTGTASASDNLIVSQKSISSSEFSNGSATVNHASAVTANEVETGSGRIQLRGNIGTVNELSNISFISGVDKVERNIFGASSLADTSGSGFSLQKTADGESVNQNIVVYDSLGKSHDVNLTFVLEDKDNDKASWRWYAETADAAQSTGIFPVGDPRGTTPAVNVGTGVVEFDNFGRFLRSDPTQPLISIPLEGQDTDSALNITPDFSILTAFAETAGSEIDVREQDGYAEGVMERFSVGSDGAVTGIYSNGMREVVAQVALAAFANPDGLVRSGANLYTVGSNSGNAMIGTAGSGERGTIKGEALELSNVDITKEFTEMITTQRAYQASARVITKSDELLQELMQIIR